MAWKRRRSTWPLILLLGLLAAATLAAPWAWQRYRAGRGHGRESRARVASREPTTIPTIIKRNLRPEPPAPKVLFESDPVERQPKLPPLAPATKSSRKKPAAIATLGDVAPQNLSVAEPSLAAAQNAKAGPAESALAADDYVVIDEPLAESPLGAPTTTPATPLVEPSEGEASETMSVDDRPVPLPAADPISDPFGEPVAQPSAIAAPPAITPTAPAIPTPLVRVDGPSDRLAMRPEPREAAASPSATLRTAPAALLEHLESLAVMPPAAFWAAEVRSRVDVLAGGSASASMPPAQAVAELRTLADRGLSDALAVTQPAVQTAWLRASRAVQRRLALWELLADPARPALDEALRREADTAAAELPPILHEINRMIAAAPEGSSWRSYLELDELAALASPTAGELPGVRAAAARQVLARFRNRQLTDEQRQFLALPQWAALERQLNRWAAGPLSLDAVTETLERYEARPTNRDAALADMRLRLASAGEPRLAALADDLNQNYRNANLRAAFSNALLNRMIPPQKPLRQRVNDTIAGADVVGQSETETEVTLRLAPAPDGWRFLLEARGDVRSRTLSETWPARLRNSSRLSYQASKEIVLNRDGMRVAPAQATADGSTRLVGVESSLSPIPLIGSLVDSTARERHQESRGRALAEVKAKVARQARLRMDREADAKLALLEAKIKTALVGPMTRFAIAAEPVDMSTTDERAIVRLRMADEQQLGAHTPRPTAPSDSLASVQLHESALNNAVRGLGLDGRRLTVGELHALLAEKIVRRAATPPADLPQRAIIEFAPHDAVRFACRGDRVELILNIVEMRKGRDSIRNVAVHAFFRPEVDAMQVKLVRDGGLQFEGRQLRTGQRIVLHGVFGKLLRADQQESIFAAPLDADPRLAGLMITQLVIDDGWIAASIGPATPQRTAWRTRDAAPRIVR